MVLKRIFVLILLIFVTACGNGNNGTEVENPINPTETTGPKKFEFQMYSVHITPLDGWTYLDYTTGEKTPGPEAFTDPANPPGDTLAHFNKGETGFFTVFGDLLDDGDTLENFIRKRFPEGNIQYRQEEDDKGKLMIVAFHWPEAIGTHKGFLINVFITDNEVVLWGQVELIGADPDHPDVGDEQMNQTWNEFWTMVQNSKITKQGEEDEI